MTRRRKKRKNTKNCMPMKAEIQNFLRLRRNSLRCTSFFIQSFIFTFIQNPPPPPPRRSRAESSPGCAEMVFHIPRTLSECSFMHYNSKKFRSKKSSFHKFLRGSRLCFLCANKSFEKNLSKIFRLRGGGAPPDPPLRGMLIVGVALVTRVKSGVSKFLRPPPKNFFLGTAPLI